MVNRELRQNNISYSRMKQKNGDWYMKKIMMVDDEADLTNTFKILFEELQGNQYQFLKANSGLECLDLLKNNQIPDVILLDIKMPGISGWETYFRIKENLLWKKIPIIFLTARKDETARHTGSFLGEDFIEKPVELGELIYKIEKVIAKQQ